MLGNVWESVEDYYNNDVFANPIPPEKGEVHVLKGGGITSDVTNAIYCSMVVAREMDTWVLG